MCTCPGRVCSGRYRPEPAMARLAGRPAATHWRPMYCVAWELRGSVRAGGSKPASPNQMADRPSAAAHFCNNICAKRTLAKAVMSEKCPTAGVRGSWDQFVRLPWSQCGVKQTRCDVHGRALPQAAKAALIWPSRTREGGRVPDNSIITPPPLMPISM